MPRPTMGNGPWERTMTASGRVYASLKESGELDNTLFIFNSDTGLSESEHGMVD